ncbi:hypothetical protein BU15DRAFT_91011 [Melanogaster broomeanus]|nr:hypothetical protein BU15DRAFT_91011 [Melanogaster broomeanus]
MVDLCPRPFKGLTVCATGIMDKPTLFKMAFELGATSTSDFTDRVTHLIANSHGGSKYTCALMHKIPIMTPAWITEAHAIWLRGDDVDLEESVSNYRLPIFSEVILSLSGIEDVTRRTQINSILTAQQGVYVKNIERPVRVTHLLCSGDIVTDKMRYAERFNKRGEANIHLVWEEWFWDCLEFGGRFDEKKYQMSEPRPESKSLHEDSAPGSHRSSAIPDDNPPNPNPHPRPHTSKSLPSVPAPSMSQLPTDPEEEEAATIKKPVPAVTLQLWKSLLKPRGFELEGGKLVRSPSKSHATTGSPPSPSSRPRPRPPMEKYNVIDRDVGKAKEKESVISSFRRAQSFALPPKEPSLRQPFRRVATTAALGPEDAEGSGTHDSAQLTGQESALPILFSGYTFRLLGEARCSNVRAAIEGGGGVVADDDTEGVSFIIVRLISGSKLYHDEPDELERCKYRTECWLEHSVFHERICELDENVSFTPLRISTPVPEAENIHLSLSGLDQSELCWIRRLLRALGVTLAPAFSPRSTHLLCPSGTGAKFDKALEWQIPVVSTAWLEDMARVGVIPAVDKYCVGGSRTAMIVDDDGGNVRRDKGKGKEKEVDHQMADITNSHSSSQPMFGNAGLLQDTAPRDRAPSVLDVPHHRPYHHHQEDIELEPESPQRGILFGKPNRLLGCDSDPPDADDGDRIPSSPPVVVDAPVAKRLARVSTLEHASPLRPRAGVIARQSSSLVSIHEAQAQGQVPSSKSPSPMKLPPSSFIPDAFLASPLHSSSVMRPPDTDAVAKALHESLTSLLGKRQMSEEAEGMKGKRVRPGVRSKAQSRQESYENFTSPSRPAHAPPAFPPPGPVPLRTDFDAPCHIDASLLDGLGGGIDMGMRSTEESLMVTYEDPAQREEKRRLMRMLGGEEGEGAFGGGGGGCRTGEPGRAKRRRVPGF